jgi:hypothetical protein
MPWSQLQAEIPRQAASIYGVNHQFVKKESVLNNSCLGQMPTVTDIILPREPSTGGSEDIA